jgi:hypothetical protein
MLTQSQRFWPAIKWPQGARVVVSPPYFKEPRVMIRCARSIASLFVAVFCTQAFAAAPDTVDASDQWQFAITPYLWLPNVSGTLRFSLPGGGADASTGPYDYLQHLQFAIMLQGEARKGDWSLFADTIYLNFGRHDSSVNATNGLLGGDETQRSAETTFRGVLVQLGGGRTVLHGTWGNVDAIVGMRYLGVRSTLDASFTASSNSGTTVSPEIHASGEQNIFDGFAGGRRHPLAGLCQVSKSRPRLPEQSILQLQYPNAVAERARFFVCWLATDRARHP